MYDSEYEEIKEAYEKKRISSEELLKEKVAPLEEMLSKSHEELVSAITRGYKSSQGMGLFDYSLEENLYVGIISQKTRFSTSGKESLGTFLSEVEKAHSLEMNSTWERDFTKIEDGNFGNWTTDTWTTLYFMERPPKVQESSPEMGCFGSREKIGVIPTEKPRLELYIGNKKTLPFLQNQLEAWRYVQLSKLLEKEFPTTDEIMKKIRKEQLEIFDKIIKEEMNVRILTSERGERPGLIKNSNGAIHHGAYIELTDEFVENLKYNPKISEHREKILRLLKTAVQRGYHEKGMKEHKKLDAGIVLKIDLREFFSKRKEMFEL